MGLVMILANYQKYPLGGVFIFIFGEFFWEGGGTHLQNS